MKTIERMQKLMLSRWFVIVLSSMIAAIIGYGVRVFLLYYINLDVLSVEDPFLCIFSLFNFSLLRLAIRSLIENLLAEPLAMNIGDIIHSDTPSAKPSGPGSSKAGGSSSQGGPKPPTESQAGPSSQPKPTSEAPLSRPMPTRPLGPSEAGPSRPKKFEHIIVSPSDMAKAGPSDFKEVVWTKITTPSQPPKVWQGSSAKFVQELEWRPEAIPASEGLPPKRPSTKPAAWTPYDPNWKPAEVQFKPISESLREEMGPPVFRVTDGKYVITDPDKIAERGYIDPATKKGYVGSSQPYLRNLAQALEHEALSRNLQSAKFNWDKFDPQTQKFIKDWMFWNENRLPIDGPFNCASVRERMVRHP